MKYPCLMQLTASDVIVAFTAERTGVVVAGKLYPIGYTATDWGCATNATVWKPVEPKEPVPVFVPKLMKSVYGGVVWLFTAPTEGICVDCETDDYPLGASRKELDHINSGNWKEVEVVQKPKEIKYPCYMRYEDRDNIALYVNENFGVWVNGKELGNMTTKPSTSDWLLTVDVDFKEVL